MSEQPAIAPAPGGDGSSGRVGDRLRTARLAAGIELGDIAARTRVPTRHLEAIERSDYAGLPSPTYATGFARMFSKAVGLDDDAIVRDLRIELGRAPPEPHSKSYEPVEPTRVPSRLLAWTAAIIALLVIGGYLLWKQSTLGEAAPTLVTTTLVEPASGPPPPPSQPVGLPDGVVVLTATTPVWVRVYDRADKVLLEREMAANESYAVPADADMPMIRTGRADAIRVTVGGREVAPLGAAQRTIRDVVLTAAALNARPVQPANPAQPAVAAPLLPLAR